MTGRFGEVTLAWGDGNYTFRLGYGELLQLQKACDAGPDYIAYQIASVHCRVDHVRETLRLGLIGGGLKQNEALTKVQLFFEGQMADYDNNRKIAFAIIEAGLRPISEATLGKLPGAAKKKAKSAGSREANSTSKRSSARRSPSASASASSI